MMIIADTNLVGKFDSTDEESQWIFCWTCLCFHYELAFSIQAVLSLTVQYLKKLSLSLMSTQQTLHSHLRSSQMPQHPLSINNGDHCHEHIGPRNNPPDRSNLKLPGPHKHAEKWKRQQHLSKH